MAFNGAVTTVTAEAQLAITELSPQNDGETVTGIAVAITRAKP